MPHTQNNTAFGGDEATQKTLFLPQSQKSSQATKYLNKVWDIRTSDALEDGALAFMARCFIQATLPHSDPGNVRGWHRENGRIELDIKAAESYDKKTGNYIPIGLPYGSIPRLLFVWMTTEAIRTKENRIFMGNSLSNFMEKLGLGNGTGGKNGTITRLKNQAYRTFRAEFTLIQSKDNGVEEIDVKVTNHRRLFWNPKLPEQGSLWESYVDLTPEFYDLLTQNPAPLDLRALRALKASSLALDIYMWLSHRTFYLDKPQKLPWQALAGQLGSDYKDLKVFRYYVRKAVTKIKAFWPELNANFDDLEIITLYPSKSLILERNLRRENLFTS